MSTTMDSDKDLFDTPSGTAMRASSLDAYEPVGIAVGTPITGSPSVDETTMVVVIRAQRILDGRRHDVMFMCGRKALAQLTAGLANALNELLGQDPGDDTDHDSDTGEDDSGDDQPDEDTPREDRPAAQPSTVETEE